MTELAGKVKKIAEKERIGNVLRIEKSSIYDGEGLRTVVFLKGCPLRCKWCSTPESQHSEPAFGYGRKMSVSDVMEEIEKDEIFFFHSGGGVTVSGGEALLQPEFVKELLQECCMRGIETAIETSFFAEFSTIEKLLPYLGNLYVDLKCMEEERHKLLTGVSNKKIHDNLRRFSTLKNRPRLHIRIPLIPGWNSDDNNLRESAQFCSQLNCVEDIELLAYHRLGTETYEKIGKKYELKDVKVPDKIFMDQCASVVREVCRGIPVKHNKETGNLEKY